MAASEVQKRNVEVLVTTVRDYMDARAEAATRINTRLATIYEDIAWQQCNQLRLVFQSAKGFGPVKLVVADILTSDDDQKIKDLFNSTNQVSLLTEIVQQKDEKGKKTAGNLDIHDMPSMYSSLDPSLEKIIILIQSWIWWDLEDAVDLVRFNQTCQRVAQIDKTGVPEQISQFYAEQFRLAAQQVSPEVIICHELGKAQDYIERFRVRRLAEEGYRTIIRREQVQESSPDMLIKALGRQYMVIDSLKERPLDQATRANYAKALGMAPETVTAEVVAAAAERTINDGKGRLKASLTGQSGGRLYDYKAWQLDRMQGLFEQIKNGREPQKLNVPKATSDSGHR
jgi:hypothetical protein